MSKTGNFQNIPKTLKQTAFRYISKSGDDSNDGLTPATANATPKSTYNYHQLVGAGIYYGGNISIYSKTLEGVGDAIFDGSHLAENATMFSSSIQGSSGIVLNLGFQNVMGNGNTMGTYAAGTYTYGGCTFDNVDFTTTYYSNYSFKSCSIKDSILVSSGYVFGSSNVSLDKTTILNTVIASGVITAYHPTYTGYTWNDSYIDNQSIWVLPDEYFDTDPVRKKFLIKNCVINCPIYSYNNGDYSLKYNSIYEYIAYLESIGVNTSTSFIDVSMSSPYSNPDNTLTNSSPFIKGGYGGATDIGYYEQAEYNSSLFPTDNYFYKNNVDIPNGGLEFNSTNLGYSLKSGINKDYLITTVRDDKEFKTLNKNIIDVEGTSETERVNSTSSEYNTTADFVIEFADNNLTDLEFHFKLDDGDLTISTGGTNDTYVYTERNVTLTEGIDFNVGVDLPTTITNIQTVINLISGINSDIVDSTLHVYKKSKSVYTSGSYDIYDPETIILELNYTEATGSSSVTLYNALGTNPNFDTYETRCSTEPFSESTTEEELAYYHFILGEQPTICKRGIGENERIFSNGDKYGYYTATIGETVTYRYVQEKYTLTDKNIQS